MDDDQIIDLYLSRSEQAISETSTKYGHYCRTIALRILSDYSEAEECENDTYNAAWNAIPPTRPNYLSAFLGRITRNIALDRFDYKRAKKRNGEFDVLLSELEECIPSANDVEGTYERGQIGKIISAFLRSIDREARFVFLRRYWYCDSIDTISRGLKLSQSKVKSMLFRTRNKLRIYLEQEGIII